MKIIKKWLKATRAPFFTASIIPVLVGCALAERQKSFNLFMGFLSLSIVILSHAGANLINDYFDARGSDCINHNITPFSGGSRMIQKGEISRSSCLRATLWTYGVCIVISGLLSIFKHNGLIFLLTILGIMNGIAYSSTFICGMKKGWGELMVGFGFGPLSVMGSYLIQIGNIDKEAFIAGIPVGLFIMGVLILNEFPDVEADEAAGKRNWVVNWGIKRSVWIYLSAIALAYLTIMFGVMTKVFPVKILFSYFTLPLAVWVGLKIWRHKEKVPELIPAMAGNIGLQFITGLLICLGLLG